jgi:hypothetical protein
MSRGRWFLTGVGVGLAFLWLVWPAPPPSTLSEGQKAAITQRVHTEILYGQMLYRLPELTPPAVGFTVEDQANSAESGCTFPLVSTGSPAWVLRVNEAMAAANYHQFFVETLPHEVGHLLRCQWDPEWQAHDARWETIVRDMGATPVPRHNYRTRM